MPDLSRMRRDYETRGLREDDLAPTWVEQFDRWFADAVAAELPEPNAVVVATADADGAPDARIVLVKGYDEQGFVFATSYASAKGAQLAVNPRAALVFPWHALQRQVRITGAQGSGILRSMSEAICMVVLGHDQGNVQAGDLVDVLVFEGLV